MLGTYRVSLVMLAGAACVTAFGCTAATDADAESTEPKSVLGSQQDNWIELRPTACRAFSGNRLETQKRQLVYHDEENASIVRVPVVSRRLSFSCNFDKAPASQPKESSLNYGVHLFCGVSSSTTACRLIPELTGATASFFHDLVPCNLREERGLLACDPETENPEDEYRLRLDLGQNSEKSTPLQLVMHPYDAFTLNTNDFASFFRPENEQTVSEQVESTEFIGDQTQWTKEKFFSTVHTPLRVFVARGGQ